MPLFRHIRDVPRDRPKTRELSCGMYYASDVRNAALPSRSVRHSLGIDYTPPAFANRKTHSTARLSSSLQKCTNKIVSAVEAFRQCTDKR